MITNNGSCLSRATRLALTVITAVVAISASAVHAQDSGQHELQEVVITGTAIRRIEGETSLPVQVLDAQAIQRTGAASVVDLIQRLPMVQGGTAESASIGGSTYGFAGVSVHNIGENRTLVLLNGRRMAQFGGQTLTGFGAAFDLNAIPVAAIERVEILTEGASALYGSDAIAGVVNFITKKRTLDRDISVHYYGPQDGGAERGVSIAGGIGDYVNDGWNLFISVGADKRSELNSRDRDFARSAIINLDKAGARWTFFNGSPRNIPANVVADNGLLADQMVSLDVLAGRACPQGSAPVDLACYYDYVRNIQLYPERERKTGVASLSFKLSDEHSLFVDALWSEAKQTSKIAPVPGELLITAGSALFNRYLAPVRDVEGNPAFVGDIVAPYRAFDLGQRINEDEADFYHVAVGLEGQMLGWDYDLAVTQSRSDVKGNISGYPGALAFARVLDSGVINPFIGPGQQSPAGQAALASINYRGYWDGGESKMQSAQWQVSRALFDLPNGRPVSLAFGLNYFKEKFQSKPSNFAQANLEDPVAGTPAVGGLHMGDQRFGDAAAAVPYGADRKVKGAFAEVLLDPFRWLELTGSIRYDDYSDVGDTTNYKASFRLRPLNHLLVRGSYGTGFHAPTVPQLKASLQSYGVTSNPYDCGAELRAIALSMGAVCRPPRTQYDVFSGGNPALQPEESENVSLGVIFEATPQISIGADYWWVGIKHAFGQLPEAAAFAAPSRYPGIWTTFTDIATATTYVAFNKTNINTGKERYAGIDFNLQGRWDTKLGKLSSQLIATNMLTNKLQLTEGGPYYKNIADYSSELDSVTFRWAGRLLASLDHGAWSHTVTGNFRTGYRDVLTTVDGINADGTFNGETLDVRLKVKSYYTFDWQSTWKPMGWMEVTVGALNLFDKDPPRSLTTANFQIGYDARYYDPRGRVLFGRISFRF